MAIRDDQMLTALKIAEVQLAQLRVLVPLKDKIEHVMEASGRFSVVFFDAHIYETHSAIDVAAGWLTGALAEWLDVNSKIMDLLGHDAFYRIVLLPYPHTLDNMAKRRRLEDYIRLTLHVHLWHGVICPVFFVDPHKMPRASIVSQNIFVAMPNSKIFIPMPDFFKKEGSMGSSVEGSRAPHALRNALRATGLAGRKPIWLFYDDDSFSGGRKLAGWRWQSLREFFRSLYGDPTHCRLCHSALSNWCLDHIAPYALGFPQMLLNFQPLCSKCNKEKGTITLSDPRTIPLLIPSAVKSERLMNIVTQSPPWLGKRSLKHTKAAVTGWFRDLM